MALLEVENMIVRYGKVEAVKGVSLNVQFGEVITLLGANGAGKSSILRTIYGLHPISSGGVRFLDKSINGRPPWEIVKSGISLVPEGRRLFPFMSVYENLLMGAVSRKDKTDVKNDLEEQYKRFPILRERLLQQAGNLSGGEQQMLAISRALMSRPQLLLLDEPSLGLAPKVVQEVSGIISELRDSGVSILLVEQNANMALKLADRAYVLETGSIYTEGDPQQLLENDHIRKAYLAIE